MTTSISFFSCKSCFHDIVDTLDQSNIGEIELTISPFSKDEIGHIQSAFCLPCLSQGKLIKAEGRVSWGNGRERSSLTS